MRDRVAATAGTVLQTLAVAAVVLAAVLVAVAWRDGRPDYQCGCSCDRKGNQIPPEEWFARTRDDDDRDSLLVTALLTALAGAACSFVGVLASAGRRRFFAGAFVVEVALGVATLVSIVELIPCLGY
jgi:hypothetical protein